MNTETVKAIDDDNLSLSRKRINNFIQSTPHQQQVRLKNAQSLMDQLKFHEGDTEFNKGAEWMFDYIKNGWEITK